MRRIAIAVAAVASALAIMLAVASFSGRSPLDLMSILAAGSVGSQFALRGSVLKAVPLLLTGVSVALAFRAGVWNIGAEGQFLVGAIAAFIAAPYGTVTAIVAAAAAGAAWASIASLLRVWRNAPEVLTTILLNFTAIHLLGWCVNGPLREKAGQYPQTDAVANGLGRYAGFHSGVLLGVVIAVAAWFLLHRTRAGLHLRAAGGNPHAARFAGIDVNTQIIRAMGISGAVAGIAGALELLGVTGRLFERFAAGYGYSGIAVALLAQLNPLATIVSAAFFGALATGAGELQRSADVSSTAATLGQALVILALVVFSALEARRWRR